VVDDDKDKGDLRSLGVRAQGPTWRIIEGDCRDTLASLDAGSVQTCVTSPPFFGLRDYGTGRWDGGDPACDHRKKNPAVDARASTLGPNRTGLAESNTAYQHGKAFTDACGKCGARRVDRQIGLEPTPDEFVAALVGVFREVRRVLADDGTVWLNLGDSYASHDPGGRRPGEFLNPGGRQPMNEGAQARNRAGTYRPNGVKAKDLIGIPWMVAFALRADGWFLRSDIIWAKPNPMPESVTDRPTKAHEYLFLLSKSARYFYDAAAIREDASSHLRQNSLRDDWGPKAEQIDRTWHGPPKDRYDEPNRNKRSVWTVATQPFPGAHFATFPPKLIEPCILAGCPEGGMVLDPFAGAGTTGMVALRHGRSFVGCELSPEYVRLARDRIIADSPLLNTAAEAA
jgi:DNA modification methylase